MTSGDIQLIKINESFARVNCDRSTMFTLGEWFKFRATNYIHHPLYKNKMWDGYIRLLNKKDQTIPVGLLPRLVEKINSDTNYSVEVDEAFISQHEPLHDVGLDHFLSQMTITNEVGEPIVPDGNQRSSVMHVLNNQRTLLISPTNSGKSLIIYLLARYLLGYKRCKKILLIVPNVGLTTQMAGDFNDYGRKDPRWKADYAHIIFKGKPKDHSHPITISTWQCVQNQPGKWFEEFDAVFVDEAHGAKATVLTKVVNYCTNAFIRFGTTGTTDGEEVNELTLEGLFGPKVQFITAAQQIESGRSSQLQIIGLNLNYSDKDKVAYNKLRDAKKMDYQTEIDLLVEHKGRTNYIVNLAGTRKGNTLVLISRVEKQGVPLTKALQEKFPDKKIIMIDGSVKADVRNAARLMAEKEDGIIFVATYKIFSTGINIKNLHHIILASPVKSKITLLQSIGRILRKHSSKAVAYVYDISDTLTNRQIKNYSHQHFVLRLKQYIEQEFKYKIIKIKLD